MCLIFRPVSPYVDTHKPTLIIVAYCAFILRKPVLRLPYSYFYIIQDT